MKRLNPKEEVIDGYKVSSDMKKVWQVELDLLAELDRVCKKYDLKYIMFDGSLLGVIRHGGIIPWDDDIDVLMMRDDYDKLLEVAEKEFKKPFFLQNPLNDNLYRGHSQLRNSDTTAIMYDEFNRDANQGIFIDIFVADKLPKNKLKRKIQRRRCRICKSLLRFQRVYDCKEVHNLKSKIIHGILSVFFGIIGYKNFFKHYEKLCAKYNNTNSDVCNINEYLYNAREIRMEHMNNLTTYDFHYMKVPGPKDAEQFLTDYFGDWKTPVIGSDDHGNMFFDAEKPYTEYLDYSIDELKKLGEKKWLKKN